MTEIDERNPREKMMCDISTDQIRRGLAIIDAKLKLEANTKFANELTLHQSSLTRLDKAKELRTITEEQYRVNRTTIAYAIEQLTELAGAGDFIENCGLSTQETEVE